MRQRGNVMVLSLGTYVNVFLQNLAVMGHDKTLHWTETFCRAASVSIPVYNMYIHVHM